MVKKGNRGSLVVVHDSVPNKQLANFATVITAFTTTVQYFFSLFDRNAGRSVDLCSEIERNRLDCSRLQSYGCQSRFLDGQNIGI